MAGEIEEESVCVNHIEQGRDQKTITITPITGHYYIGVPVLHEVPRLPRYARILQMKREVCEKAYECWTQKH